MIDLEHNIKKVVFNNLFYQFSKDANFEPIACRPYRPQTKGSVESLAKFVEQRLRPYDYEFYDAVELIGLVWYVNIFLDSFHV
ncbi:hypothetical protein [Staphylococcus aureus]|uniref:hypothetical protein n=1 Tax=Staphylococcus aureus TaxID=1280 RepID=UPI002270462E|nr:hypothetical protein [Staphylococcus aureus]